MAITIALSLQFAVGVWTNVWADVAREVPVELQYGISGSGPLDRVGDTGQMTFALNNDRSNSGGATGYYAPGHASCRSGFELGILARIVITSLGVDYYKFVGTLIAADPTPGQFRSSRTFCSVVDWFDEAARQKVRLIATQTSKRGDELITTLLAAMTRQPTATSLGTGQETFAYAFDNSRDEAFTPLTEFQRIAMSELGFIYMKGDTATGGVLRFDNRQARPSVATATYTLSDDMVALKVSRARDKVYNRVKVTTHPRRVDTGVVVLFALSPDPTATQFQVKAGTSMTITGQYTDPTLRAARVGGTSMVAPVATTDYLMNGSPDGLGANYTANFTVTATAGGNSAEFVITNGGANDAYITKLQIRGLGLYDYGELVTEKSDATSKTAYGENALDVDMPMQADALIGQDAANYLALTWKDPHTLIDGVEFLGSKSAAHLLAALGGEPGTRVTIAETATGLNRDFYIQGVGLTVIAPEYIKANWIVTPSDPFQAWLLGTVGASEMGATTTLGY